MRSFKGILLTGTAILALVACSSDKGPGEIGSLDDIVIRNAGDKSAPPPPSSEPVKEVKLTEEPAATAEAATAEPSADEVIAAADTGKPRAPEAAPAAPVDESVAAAQAQEAAVREDLAEQKEVTQAAAVGGEVSAKADAQDLPQDDKPAEGVTWNQTQRALEQPPVRDDASIAAHVPSEPPVEDQFAAQEAESSMAAAQADVKAQQAAAPAVQAPAPAAAATATGVMPIDPSVLHSKDKSSIIALQKTLKEAGYYKGPLDGVMASETLNAYVKYQTAANASVAPAANAPAMATPVTAPVASGMRAAPAPLPAAHAQATQAPTPVASPAPTPAPEAAPAAPAAATPSALMVSRRAPEPLPAAGAVKSVARADAVAVAQQQPAPAAAPAPTPFTAANVSLNDPRVISAAQAALAAKGIYNGAPTGQMDTATLNALSRYQGSNGLTPGGLNVETLKSLGVITE